MARTLNVNGKDRSVEVSDDKPLLWVLREELGLVGTKYACGIAACGACTVHIDGKAVRTCIMPVGSIRADQRITTIEGLPGAAENAVQRAWVKNSVPQCGYCQSGMIMAATALLAKNPSPSDADIDQQMTNICRCGTYQLVRAAIKEAAAELQSADMAGGREHG